MDSQEPQNRKKKGDKAKEKREHNGGYSQKHVRLQEALKEKRGRNPATPQEKKKG